jgi:hypothetical protein
MREKGQQKMYVAISAYEHPDLVETLLNCRDTADNPEDIVFGIGIKYASEPDFSGIKNFFKQKNDLTDYPNDVMPGELQVLKGLVDMVEQEDYILKIDPGYRFKKGWDTALKNDIEELNSEGKFVISGHVNSLLDIDIITEWEMSEDYEKFNLSSKPKTASVQEIKNMMVNDKYFKNHFINTGFFFAKTSWIKDIKFPTYHRAAWQDQELSIISYCYGYDAVSPTHENSYIFLNNNNDLGKVRTGDVENSKSNVVKLLIRGKNRLFDVTEAIRPIEDFYKEIGLEDTHRMMKAEMDQWIYDIANEIRIKN